MLRFLTAGESHGQALVVTIDGMPAGLELDIDALNAQLRRRQGGYGRGRRMQIESDRAEILSGVRTAARPARPSRCSSATATGSTGSRRCTSSGRCPRAPPAPTAPTSRGRAPATPISPAPSSTATTTSATCSSAPAPARRRRASPPARSRASCWRSSASASPATSSVIGDVVLPRRPHGVVRRGRARSPTTRRSAASTPRSQQRMIAAIDARARGRRHARRRLRGHRHRRAAGPRLVRAVGPQARRPARRRRCMCIHAIKAVGIGIGPEVALRPARASTTRSCRRRAAPTRRCGPPTTPAASKAASPTARTCASPGS